MASAGSGAVPPVGALIPLGGPQGCVERGDGSDGCVIGRGLNRVHSVAISPDGRFLYSGAGSVADPPADDGAIGVFAVNQATGEIVQTNGKQGCVKNPNAVGGREGGGMGATTGGGRL